MKLPQTQEELRDIMVLAWNAGWVARRRMIGKPGGTIAVERTRQRATFLADAGLPPLPPPLSVQEAIKRFAE